jgi:hypothetical protein
MITSNLMEVLIPKAVQLQARSFAVGMSNLDLAEKIYLNTLAVYAVESFLQSAGIETHWAASDSWQPNLATPINVADLEVMGAGKVECRPVLLDCAAPVEIPLTAVADRVAYVAVGFGTVLDRAQLLGFVYEYPLDTLALSLRQFRKQSMESLPNYLRTIQRVMAVIEERDEHPLRMVQEQFPDRSLNEIVARLEEIFVLESNPDLQNRRVQSCLQEWGKSRSLMETALNDDDNKIFPTENQQLLALQVAEWFRQVRA